VCGIIINANELQTPIKINNDTHNDDDDFDSCDGSIQIQLSVKLWADYQSLLAEMQ
jgi:hypothetical protein